MKTKRKTKIALIVVGVVVILLLGLVLFAGNFLFAFALDPPASP